VVRLDLATHGGAAISRLRIAVVAYLAVAIDEPVTAVSGSVVAGTGVTRPAAARSASHDDGAGISAVWSASADPGTAHAGAIDVAAPSGAGRTGAKGEEQHAHTGG
jgi:hypothetical protein